MIDPDPDTGREIELKFVCEPGDVAAVLAAAPGEGDEARELISVYFDTPSGDLRKAGASLRVRSSGGQRVQTLKRGEGLSREEHEVAVESDTPDAYAGPLAEILEEDSRGRLLPSFRVTVTRRQRTFRRGEAEIELAVDQGRIGVGRRTIAICEVELELKAGPPEALFEVARELLDAAPLYLSFDGKATQGQLMAAGAALRPRRGDKGRLPKSADAGQAFQTVARNALVQISANAALMRRLESPEAVHQLRVAARRLKSALATFRPLLDPAGRARLKVELEWLTEACGPARALDVFTAGTLRPAARRADPPAGLGDLAVALELARKAAHAEAARAVATARFRRFVLDAAEWVELGAWLIAPATAKAAREPAARFAMDALSDHRNALLERGRGLDEASDAERHKARIAAKKLRYAAEAFAPLFEARAVDRFVGRLKTVQDRLGALNDIATEGPMLEGLGLAGPAAFAAGRLVGERVAAKPGLVGKAARALKRLAEAESFWS